MASWQICTALQSKDGSLYGTARKEYYYAPKLLADARQDEKTAAMYNMFQKSKQNEDRYKSMCQIVAAE
eukprot:scaffold9973_cov40-Prasinocladus_malaysianus.AAC.1